MSSEILNTSVPYDLEKEPLEEFFASFHKASQQRKQAVLNLLIKAPEPFVSKYLQYCKDHYCEASISNLHFLLSHPRFLYRELLLVTLEIIRSPRSVDFLYHYSTNCTLHLKKRVLSALRSFPQSRAHPVLIEYLAQEEVELKHLALQVILNLENFDNSKLLESQLESPFPLIRKLTLKALHRFEGSCWFQRQFSYFTKLEPAVQSLLLDHAGDFDLVLNFDEQLQTCQDFSVEVLLKILKLLPAELGTTSQEYLLPLLSHEDRQVRLLALKNLSGKVVRSKLVDFLIQRIEIETNPTLLEAIFQCFDGMEEPQKTELYLRLASTHLDRVSSFLLPEFKLRLDDSRVEEMISCFLEDPCSYKAAFALHLLEDPEPYENLIRPLLKSPRKPIQSRARELVKILEHKDLDKVFSEAQELFETGDFPQVRWTLEDFLKNRPEDTKAWILYAKAQVADSNKGGARDSLKTLLRFDPDHVAGLKLLASLYLESGEAREAAPLLKKAAHHSSGDPQLLEQLFSCYLQLNEIDHALEIFESIPTQFTNPALCESFFSAALDSSGFESIIKHYPNYERLCLNSNPPVEPTSKAKTAYGIALYRSDRPKDAQRVFQEIVKAFHPNVQNISCLKEIFQTTGELSHEEAYLEGSLNTFPDDPSQVSNLLEFYSHNFPERCLERMEVLDPSDSFLRVKARTLRKVGKIEESTELFETLFLQNSSDESIPFELGLNHFQRNQFKKALKYFQYYSKHQTQPQRLHYYLSLCYERLGYRDLSAKHLVFSLQIRPVDLDAWILYVETLAYGNVPEELLEYLKDAQEVLHDHPDGLKKLGSFYQERKDSLACPIFERVAELCPDDDEVHLVLANYYYEAKKYSKAFSHFHKVKKDLQEPLLERYSLCAERSLNYAEAFHLYLRLYKEPENQEILKPKIQNLVAHKDSFYHICEHVPAEVLRTHATILEDFPLFTYKMAGRSFRDGKLSPAKTLFERLRKSHGAFLRSDFFLAMICLHQDHKEEARTHLENALLHEDPKPVQIYSILGETSFDLDDFERARHCFIKVFQSGKRTVEALEYLFQIYRRENQIQRFLHLITRGTERLLNSPSIRFLAGKAHMEMEEFERAKSLLEGLPENSAYRQQALYLSAQCSMKMENFKDALQVFKELEPIQESLEDFSFQYALCLKSLQRFPSAIQQFTIALEYRQRRRESLLQLVDTHMKCMRPDEALPFFLDACAEKLPFEECYQLCKSLYSLGRYEDMEKIYDLCYEEIFEAPSSMKKGAIIQGFLLAFYNRHDSEKLNHCTQRSAKTEPVILRDFLSQRSLSSGFRFELLKRVCELIPKEPAFPYHLARFYHAAKRVALARQYFVKALHLLEAQESDLEIHFETLRGLATITYESKEMEECLNYLQSATAIRPDHPEVLEKLSYVHGLRKELDHQAKVDQKLFFLKSDNALVSKRLYSWFQNSGDLQNSIFHLKNYLKENPSDVEKVQLLATLSNQTGMHAQEIQAYQMLENLGIELPVNHFLNVGRAYLALNREEKAAECFQKYLSKNPENQGLHFQLGMIYKKQGFLKKSVFTFREILRKDNSNTTVKFELANALFEDRNLQESKEILEELLSIKPYHTAGRELLAKIHYKKGENRSAMEILDQLLKANPDNVEARLMQARLFRSEGMLEEACGLYEELFRKTRSEEYLLELGVLNLKLNRKHTALKHLRQLADTPESKSRFTRMAKSLLKREKLA